MATVTVVPIIIRYRQYTPSMRVRAAGAVTRTALEDTRFHHRLHTGSLIQTGALVYSDPDYTAADLNSEIPTSSGTRNRFAAVPGSTVDSRKSKHRFGSPVRDLQEVGHIPPL